MMLRLYPCCWWIFWYFTFMYLLIDIWCSRQISNVKVLGLVSMGSSCWIYFCRGWNDVFRKNIFFESILLDQSGRTSHDTHFPGSELLSAPLYVVLKYLLHIIFSGYCCGCLPVGVTELHAEFLKRRITVESTSLDVFYFQSCCNLLIAYWCLFQQASAEILKRLPLLFHKGHPLSSLWALYSYVPCK